MAGGGDATRARGGRGNVLVVYRAEEYPLRKAVADHLYCLRRYSDRRCFYLNLGLRSVPGYIGRIPFDMVVFHTSFLSARWSEETRKRVWGRADPLKRMNVMKVALPQDEFFRTSDVAEFIDEHEVDVVLSVSPPSEWPKQYEGVDFERVRFERILTGYLDEDTVRRAERLRGRETEPEIDVGYRAWHAAPWLGRHGRLKTRVAEAFADRAPEYGLTVDISTRHEDTLLGDSWLEYLTRCRYTIGVEGGASILDADGTIRERTDAFTRAHPEATFEEIEAACFPGRDGELDLRALSPRHLEACATRTCQVLVEGDYNGVLRAGEHYIPLSADLSNLDSVLETIRRDDQRGRITEAAYRDIVASGRWSYARLVEQLERAAEASRSSVTSSRRSGAQAALLNGLAEGAAPWRRRFAARVYAPFRDRIGRALGPSRHRLRRLLGRGSRANP